MVEFIDAHRERFGVEPICQQLPIAPSTGSVGDSYDNAMAETVDNAMAETVTGLFKVELIHRRRPWRHLDAVEYATLEWVDWFNNRRLLEPLGHVPPTEFEAPYHQHQASQAKVA
jgi:transposase InsO family protein